MCQEAGRIQIDNLSWHNFLCVFYRPRLFFSITFCRDESEPCDGQREKGDCLMAERHTAKAGQIRRMAMAGSMACGKRVRLQRGGRLLRRRQICHALYFQDKRVLLQTSISNLICCLGVTQPRLARPARCLKHPSAVCSRYSRSTLLPFFPSNCLIHGTCRLLAGWFLCSRVGQEKGRQKKDEKINGKMWQAKKRTRRDWQ